MNPIKLFMLCCTLFLFYTHSLLAQNPSQHWAKQVYASTGISSSYTGIATDKQGNVYALYNTTGYIRAYMAAAISLLIHISITPSTTMQPVATRPLFH